MSRPTFDERVMQLDRMAKRALVRHLANLEYQAGGVRVIWRACPIADLSKDELIWQILEREGYKREQPAAG